LGISTIIPYTLSNHIAQFVFAAGSTKTRQSIMQVLWFATVWEIWKERNNRIFKAKECSIIQVVDKIKSLSYMWLKTKFASLPLNYHGWWLYPFTMLGIG